MRLVPSYDSGRQQVVITRNEEKADRAEEGDRDCTREGDRDCTRGGDRKAAAQHLIKVIFMRAALKL